MEGKLTEFLEVSNEKRKELLDMIHEFLSDHHQKVCPNKGRCFVSRITICPPMEVMKKMLDISYCVDNSYDTLCNEVNILAQVNKEPYILRYDSQNVGHFCGIEEWKRRLHAAWASLDDAISQLLDFYCQNALPDFQEWKSDVIDHIDDELTQITLRRRGISIFKHIKCYFDFAEEQLITFAVKLKCIYNAICEVHDSDDSELDE